MRKPKVIVLRTAGTNCDRETAFAFESAGAAVELVHINELTLGRASLEPYQIMALPGGFTYGDDIASGKILANELKFKLKNAVRKFISSGKLIIGICNGFQILVKAGLLPNLAGDFDSIEATLTINDSAKFEDRWVHLKKGKTGCIWTKGIKDTIYLPVAHGEGKFVPRDKEILNKMKNRGMIVFSYVNDAGSSAKYPDNPNGSVEGIAGICDPSGRIFGLMPHPERHISPYQGPVWTRSRKSGPGDGFAIFENGVDFAKINL